MGGKGLTVFQSQFEAVEMATPRERIGSGNSSPTTTQATGPQVTAKKKMLRQMKAIMALTALSSWFSVLPDVTLMMAVASCIKIMPEAPQMSRNRRPNFDGPEREGRRQHVDEGRDEGDEEGV